MGALLESDVFVFTHRIRRSKPSHYRRPTGPSLTTWGQTARHQSGVGTSRSALLLTVRVESGIARTKSNNGLRSWLCSFLLRSRHSAAARHNLVNPHMHTRATLRLIYPNLCDHLMKSGWFGRERDEWQVEVEEVKEVEGIDRNGHLWRA